MFTQTRSFVVCWAGGSYVFCSSLLVWRTQNRTGLVRVRTILGLDCENDGWMDVRTIHGCFLTADRTGFGLVPCLLPLLLPSCFVLPGFALGLVLPTGNHLVYLFGDAGCGLVTGCQNSRGWSRTPHHCLGSAFEWLLLTSSPLWSFAVRFNSCVQSSIAFCRCDCCLASSL